MFRNATQDDFEFICNLVLVEAKNGHFNRDLLNPVLTRNWQLELKGILTSKRRHNGVTAYGLIWLVNEQQAGFVLMSGGPNNKGNELYMAAIAPEFRGHGEGKKMIVEVLKYFKGRNLSLVARCSRESEAMFHILTENGFKHMLTGEEGSRGLMYTG